MDRSNCLAESDKAFWKKVKNCFFYKIQNGGKSKEAHLIATMNLFVEQVQVNLYTKFQVNRSLLKKSISFLPQRGARETIFFKQIRKLKNHKFFTSSDMREKFHLVAVWVVRPVEVSVERKIITLRNTIGSSTTKS